MTPTLTEIADCFGWRWKAALLLLLGSPAATLLPFPAALWTGIGMLAAAALLALMSSIGVVRQMLEPEAHPVPDSDPLMTLSAILEGQRSQMHEAAAAVSRAVTAGAQLASLSRNAEQQWRNLIDQGQAIPPSASSIALLEELRAGMLLAREEDAAAREAAEKDLRRRLEDVTARLDALAARPTAPPIPPEPATPAALDRSLADLEALSQKIALQFGQASHHEASLGDAARYLTETVDRLGEGVRAVETHAVRLQAMISLSGHRQDDAIGRQAMLMARLEELVGAARLEPEDPMPALLQGIADHLRAPEPPRSPQPTAPDAF
jgi:hypothetical protein